MDNDDRKVTAMIFTFVNFVGFIVSFAGFSYNLKDANEEAAWGCGFLIGFCLVNAIVLWLTNFYAERK